MIVSTDLGLTGYISFCSIEDGLFIVNKTTKIITQSKNHKLDVLKETTSIVKNQIDFTANYEMIIDNIKDDENNIGLFEQITTRPFNSKVSSMSLADTSAVFRCLFESLSIDYKIVPPGNWKRFLNVTSDKKTSIELFNRLVSEGNIIIDFKKNIKNHNEIESILIAYYYYCINKKSLI